MKRVLSVFLTEVMLITVIPMSAVEAECSADDGVLIVKVKNVPIDGSVEIKFA